MRHRVVGSVVGVVISVGFGAAMLPLRSHLAIATAALVLVVPVVVGVALGGFTGGVVSVVAGFFVYDFVFIPPYYTLNVGRAENWTALIVYVVVMLLVARVVASLDEARTMARRREVQTRHLFEVSELLLGDKAIPELGQAIVRAVHEVFALSGVTLLVSIDEHLEVVASVGESISDRELARLQPEAKVPVALSTTTSSDPVQALALVASGRPVGLLALSGLPPGRIERELLPILANHLALALERSQLRERVARAELLEEVDRLRRALVGAVSHDLRTPLATIKVASSTLVNSAQSLSDADTAELYGLIDVQADRLARLVGNLLDMTRIQAGVLEVRQQPESVLDLVTEVLVAHRPSLGGREVVVEVSQCMPLINVDRLLIGQALGNILDNADRHAPIGTAITMAGVLQSDGSVALSVTDQGPGVPPSKREAVFETFMQFDTGGRSGLGLAIAQAFVEAHGDRIWVEDAPGGGARFVFTVPVLPSPEKNRI